MPARLEELAMAGGDVNPLKSDPELQILLKKLDQIKKYRKFQGWKAKFLERLEQFLYEEGMTPAQKACNDFDAELKKNVKRATKVKDFIDKGELSSERKTVKAALALNEMCNTLTGLVTDTENLIPYRGREEKKRGFTKFHLGAVLIRQGFHQYITMKVIEDALKEIGEKAEEVADRQQHDLFAAYIDQVQRFCDVMADLNLYEVMMKCLQFAEEPEDESEDPPAIEVTVLTHDGKTLKLELEVSETIANVKDSIADACQIPTDRQVMTFRGKELTDDSKTLEQLDIQDGATLKVEPMKIPIVVNTMDGKKIELMIDPTAKLGVIKQQLEAESGLLADNQKLLMNGIEFNDDDCTPDFYGIKPGTELDLEPKSIKITVDMPNGKSHTIEVTPSDTTDAIKEKIAEDTGMAVPRQVLKFGGNELPSDKAVKDMGIKEGSVIKVDIFKVPIKVNTPDGQLEVMIDPTDKLSAIKKQLEEDSGIPAQNQKLSLNGIEFNDDNCTAEFYGIGAGSEIDLEPKSIKVAIEMPNGRTHTVEINPSDTSDAIKAKVAEVTGMAVPRQVLKLDGKELPNEKAASDMGIKDNSTIKVEVFKVPVTVSTMDGRKIKAMIDPTQKMSDIKKQLETESGISADNQKLFLGGNELGDDSKTAAEYGIESGSELDLEPKSIKVTVEMPTGVSKTMDIKPSDTSDSIKKKIEQETGMAVPRQLLKFNGKELPKGQTAKDMGIEEGSALKVEVFKVPITVTTMDGTPIKAMIDPTEKMSDIKKQLEKESGLSADNQKLSMGGKELADDDKTASDYGIGSGSELDLEPKFINVTVEMPDGTNKTIGIKPSDTSDTMKKKIEQETGMAAPRQLLKFNGKELPKGQTAKDMGIEEGSTLKVEVYKVPITVTTMDGRSIKATVDPTEKLGKIKKQLEKESGLSADNQKLFMNGEELADDNKAAADYGIGPGSELNLEPKCIKVTVEMPDGTNKAVKISPTDTSDTIKKKIEDETGMIAPRQVLKFEGKELPKGKTVKDLGIEEGSTLKVEVFKVPISVETMDGKHIKVQVDPTEKLGDIKRQLEKESGLPPKNQRLFLNGKELSNDNKTASAYDIKAGSELELEPKSIKVTVEMPDGKECIVDIQPSDTSDKIKAKIAEQSGMDAPRQVLKFDGQEIPKGKTVKDLQISEGSALKVEIFKLPITVQTKGGKSFSIDVEPCNTVDYVKKIVEKKTGIEHKKQCLKFGENELDISGRTVQLCGIKEGSTLTVEPHMDPIIFVDIKCGTLFALDRDEVVERGALTTNQGNKRDFLEAAQDAAARDKILTAMKGSPALGVATQVVVEKLEVEDYDLEEAEKVSSMWGVKLKKREKNKKGEEFLFVDPKTGQTGELSRKKYIDMKLITPVSSRKGETLQEAETDTEAYDKYVAEIRNVFGIQSVT